jgi:hypothetical protein
MDRIAWASVRNMASLSVKRLSKGFAAGRGLLASMTWSCAVTLSMTASVFLPGNQAALVKGDGAHGRERPRWPICRVSRSAAVSFIIPYNRPMGLRK